MKEAKASQKKNNSKGVKYVYTHVTLHRSGMQKKSDSEAKESACAIGTFVRACAMRPEAWLCRQYQTKLSSLQPTVSGECHLDNRCQHLEAADLSSEIRCVQKSFFLIFMEFLPSKYGVVTDV